jgi:hypothetical protein
VHHGQRTSRVPADESPFSRGGVLSLYVKFALEKDAEVEEGDRLKNVDKLEKVLPVEEALQFDLKDGCSVSLEEKE